VALDNISKGHGRVSAAGVWKATEMLAWAVAICCLGYVALLYLDRVVGHHEATRDFVESRAPRPWPPDTSLDMSLWSPKRMQAWQSLATLPRPVPLAMLHIPRIRLSVPVLEGTDDVTLNRGLSHIEETAAPGADGNAGIAGHRDGFFRGLKDAVVGDVIELETLRETQSYRIERIWIVDPSDVSVLDPTAVQSITLVTCYPFYFVGSAPQRFIVRAVRVDRTALSRAEG
jgi:sortase A